MPPCGIPPLKLGRPCLWNRVPGPGVPYASLMIEPGDGSVTKASLMAYDSLDPKVAPSDLPVASATFICLSMALKTCIYLADTAGNRQRGW